MRHLAFILFLALGPMPVLGNTASAGEVVRSSAAAYTRTVTTDLVFDDGSNGQLRTRRYGVEYWEDIRQGVQGGFVIGYSESELRESGLLQDTASGNYGGLGLRFRWPLTAHFTLESQLAAVYQKDTRRIDDSSYRFRTIENSAELGLQFRTAAFFLAGGGSWERVDFLQSEEDGPNLAAAEAREDAGVFAEAGLYAERGGSVALRWTGGTTEGWMLRYARDF